MSLVYTTPIHADEGKLDLAVSYLTVESSAAIFILIRDGSCSSFLFTDSTILFPFSFTMVHTAFSTLTDRVVHVLGQFQHFNQICKLFHGKRSIVDTKVDEEQAVFLFFDAAAVYRRHRLWQDACPRPSKG